MKKIYLILAANLIFIFNVNALSKGSFIHDSTYICEESQKYSVDLLSYEGILYYFLEPQEYNNYNNVANTYYFVDDVLDSQEIMNYNYLMVTESINDQKIFFYRYLWESQFPDRVFDFCDNDSQKENRYQLFKNKMNSIIAGPNFDEPTLGINERKIYSYQYLNYFEIWGSENLNIIRNGDKLTVSAKEEGEYYLYLAISNKVNDAKLVTDSNVFLANPSTFRKVYQYKITVIDNGIIISPPDTLDISGLWIIVATLALIIYVFKKK